MEGIGNVLSRISEIQSQFSAESMAPPVDGDFQALLQQAQGDTTPTMLQGNFGGAPLFNPAMLSQMGTAAGNVSGDQIATAANKMAGTQYWSEACAHAVNDCLKSVGVDISTKVNGNPNWVPNYASLGTKVEKMDDLKPGDLVIYNNEIGQGGYDHIGIYAGDGEAWNVSSAEGHKWARTKIGNCFQEGRRIAS